VRTILSFSDDLPWCGGVPPCIEPALEWLGDESESEDTAIAAEARRSADADIGRKCPGFVRDPTELLYSAGTPDGAPRENSSGGEAGGLSGSIIGETWRLPLRFGAAPAEIGMAIVLI